MSYKTKRIRISGHRVSSTAMSLMAYSKVIATLALIGFISLTSSFQAARAGSVSAHQLIDEITALRIAFSSNGEEHFVDYSLAELSQLQSDEVPTLKAPGYVTGVVAFTSDEDPSPEIKVEQISLVDEIESSSEFPFSALTFEGKKSEPRIKAKYYGVVDPPCINLCKRAYYDKATRNTLVNPKKSSSIRGGYSFFSRITGDPISSQYKDFTVRIRGTTGAQLDIQVEQPPTFRQKFATAHGIEINYYGDSLQEALWTGQSFDDFMESLNSFSRGVREIESRLNMKLVSDIRVLDYPLNNALSLENSTTLWIDIPTLYKANERTLINIGSHEALHIFVDQTRLTRGDAIRQLFAGFKGWDLFSMERFLLLTQGIVRADSESDSKSAKAKVLADNGKYEGNQFFAFFNEMNVLYSLDADGGHSEDNLDEFCVSFLHALLYPELIKESFLRDEIRLGKRSFLEMTSKRRQGLLSDFRKALTAFAENRGVIETGVLDRSLKVAENLHDAIKHKDGTYLANQQAE